MRVAVIADIHGNLAALDAVLADVAGTRVDRVVCLGDVATLLCFHGSPHSNTDSIVATTPDTALTKLLHGYSATVLAGGHTHAPFIRRYKEAVFLNPGSVGFPYEVTDAGIRHPPWAE